MTPRRELSTGRRVRLRVAAVLLGVLLTALGCGQDRPPPGDGSTAAGSSGATSAEPPAADTSAEGLVGMWGTDDPGAGEILYRFDADGTYAYVGLLLQERASGIFRFQRQAGGDFAVDGDQLVLTPREGRETLEDPDAPSSDFDRPMELTEERYTWSLEPDGLTLVGADGIRLHLVATSG